MPSDISLYFRCSVETEAASVLGEFSPLTQRAVRHFDRS